MIYATRRERIEAEKLQRRGRNMRSMKVGVASFATFAGVTVAGVAPAYADYTVERGDTLSEIAAQHDNVTVSTLMQSNGLSSSLIYPGQRLSFSGSSSSSESASTKTYTVVSGDTLSEIAAQHGTSVSALMSENGLTSTLIYPGDQLTIPGGSSSASSNASTSSSRSNSPASTSTTSNSPAKSSAATQAASKSAPSTSGASWAISTASSSSASYRLGANGEGNQWDCSSFTQKALSQDGKSIPRTSAAQ